MQIIKLIHRILTETNNFNYFYFINKQKKYHLIFSVMFHNINVSITIQFSLNKTRIRKICKPSCQVDSLEASK